MALLRTATAGLVLLHCGNAQLVDDTPYPELISLRQPFAGVWSSPLLPSAWQSSVCSNVTHTVRGATDASPEGGSALLACESAFVDAITGARWSSSVSLAPELQLFGSGAAIAGASFLAASPSTLYRVTCAASACTFSAAASHTVGAVQNLLAFPSVSVSGTWFVWLTGPNGTVAFRITPTTASPVYSDAAAYAALAYSAVKREVALGNRTKLLLLDASAAVLEVPHGFVPPRSTAGNALFPQRRFLWVTNISQGWGGEVDDVVTALAYDDFGLPSDGLGSGNGTLYIGNPTALNIMMPDGTMTRVDGMGGLPWGNITSLVVAAGATGVALPPLPTRPSRYVYVGTTMGLVLFDPFGTQTVTGMPYQVWTSPYGMAGAVGGAPGSSVPAAYQPTWRYLYGPRWFPTTPADNLGSSIGTKGIVTLPASAVGALHLPVGRNQQLQLGQPSGADVAVVITAAGIATLQTQQWTLADKAELMESLLPPHIVDGQVNDCSYPSFGVATTCAWDPEGANNGLWTSLLVAAESFRWSVTQAEEAKAAAWTVFGGMKLLNDVTGIRGLIARCASDSSYPFPNQPNWYHSTSVPGYSWQGDASSDEVSGHMLAYPVMADLVAAGNSSAVSEVASVLVNMARYITQNNFTLVDVTGKPTRWGHWEPAVLNELQSWSDGRGLNSLQILALLVGALKYTQPGSADDTLFRNALQYLAHDQGYVGNLANLKINVPSDINYSDDELAFFAYYALLSNANVNDPLQAPIYEAALTSIKRSWYGGGVARSRGNLWGAIYLASIGAVQPVGAQQQPGVVRGLRSVGATRSQHSKGQRGRHAHRVHSVPGLPLYAPASPALSSANEAAQVAADVAWNLRTWAVELTGWPAQNSHRQDLIRDPNADRFGNAGDTTVVLPMNERVQGRWNADPFTMDGDAGTDETDPGVWLMPYWMSRYYNIIGAPEPAAASSRAGVV